MDFLLVEKLKASNSLSNNRGLVLSLAALLEERRPAGEKSVEHDSEGPVIYRLVIRKRYIREVTTECE